MDDVIDLPNADESTRKLVQRLYGELKHKQALIDKKAAGEEFEAPVVAAKAPAVIDLMAALEASVKYLAVDLGGDNIRVCVVEPGATSTCAT